MVAPCQSLSGSEWKIPRLIELLGPIDSPQSEVKEFQHEFPTIGRRKVRVNVSRAGLDNALILLAVEDVTGRTRAEESLRASVARLRALVSSMDDIVFEVDAEGNCLSAWTGDPQLLARSQADLRVHNIEDFLPAQSSIR